MGTRTLVWIVIWLSASSAWAEDRISALPSSAPEDPRPTLYMPLTMFVPGAAALVAGGAVFGTIGLDSDKIFRLSVAMMASGAALVVGSAAFWAARIAKRVRWNRRQRRWRCDTYGIDCPSVPRRPPALYGPVFVFIPGAALLAAGAVLFVAGQAEERAKEAHSRADPTWEDESIDTDRPTGIALLTAGGSLVLASAVFLAVRLAKRAHWKRERGIRTAAPSFHLLPVLGRGGAGRNLGAALIGTF